MIIFEPYALGELVKFKGGTGFPKDDQGESSGDYPFVKVSDMNTNANAISLVTAENWVSEETAKKLKAFVHPPGSVAFAKIGVALTYNRRRRIVQPTILDNNMMSAIPDVRKVDPSYLYFLLCTIDFNTIASGSALPYLTAGSLNKIQVSLPDLANQVRIAEVLCHLDDKIELNRRINETLEAMAQAIFRDWFVDFGPTRRKMEGATDPVAILGGLIPTPEKAAPLAALFPAALGDDGLPDGWTRQKLGDWYSVLETGKRPRGGVGSLTEGVPSVGAESIKRVGVFDHGKTKYVERAFFEAMKKGKVNDGDVLVYKDGGKPGELRPAVSYVSECFPFEEFCINEHVFRVRTARISQPVLYCLLSTDDAMWQMREMATGVAQPGLNQTAMNSISFNAPDDDALYDQCAQLISPLINGCNSNAKQNETLAATRDLLLPKLISGEIRLRDVEAVA